ncbi:asparagine synthase-related protein [Butyrivibrio sp. DSM 10294]|uniref:asparagine synthase-related protein n=1 Tax=Butyrivibrio sp. DSM 10294 TaxID=2972457 RepID=UPI00234EB092|nr:asparagine synthase-related protein [Butyrivibrio sp. DSM 10294]MDC7292344.1 asparagine synthase-related protein [Butyrivibrio sp. DSM 10294]
MRTFVTALFGPYSGARYVFPFPDKDVINYAVSIPRHLYINNCQKRYIYRQAFKDIMPTSLYESTNKAIFFSEGEIKEETDWFPKEHIAIADLLTDMCYFQHMA